MMLTFIIGFFVFTFFLMNKFKIYDECKKVLNYPTYLSKKLTDLDNLFIRPIFTSDLREINYEVTSWYNTQKTNYDKFKGIIDLL